MNKNIILSYKCEENVVTQLKLVQNLDSTLSTLAAVADTAVTAQPDTKLV